MIFMAPLLFKMFYQVMSCYFDNDLWGVLDSWSRRW